MGDFNANIGKCKVMDIFGDFELGQGNERGDRLVDFFQHYETIATNTSFVLPMENV